LPDLTRANAEPFSAHMYDFWPSYVYTTSGEFEVPMGKRLVVEFVSIAAAVPTGQRVRAQLRTDVSHAVRLTRDGPWWYREHWTASQLLRAYAEPRQTVTLYVSRFGGDWSGQWSATIVGYLVPA
jgi:hypothetical protein